MIIYDYITSLGRVANPIGQGQKHLAQENVHGALAKIPETEELRSREAFRMAAKQLLNMSPVRQAVLPQAPFRALLMLPGPKQA